MTTMSLSESAPGTLADCYALLDDSDATPGDPRSRLYTDCVAALSCEHASQFPDLLAAMELALLRGQYAVGVFTYELGAEMHAIEARDGTLALAHVLLFERCERLSAEAVADWIELRIGSAADASQAGIAQVRASVTEATFTDAIASIRAYIEAGDNYQTNYTYRMRFDAYGSPFALYKKLRARQPVPYGALIALPDGRAVLSLSPELFVRHRQRELLARPMKGTAAASGEPQEDARRAAALAADPKNRAENLMIVDLLRNDLGRIAALGSVKVPALFEVKRYSNVLQMTSTVQARLRDDVTLSNVFAALYPCGSITGAPKRRTMQIIRELEPDPRGIYTGAIGWFDPPAEAYPLGDFCMSVPIRTLVLQAENDAGIRTGEMGVGAGIVHDSDAADEFVECQLKARFLTGLTSDFELFETIHATHDGCRHFERHLQRLRASAAYFGFVLDEAAIRASVQNTCANLAQDGAHRLRLALNQAGVCSIQTAPLAPWPAPVRVQIAPQATIANDLFLRHKTTVRQRYDAAWRAAEVQGAFDRLFFNTDGELTEGARSNVFIKFDGRWYTPPLAAGLLPGVMRAVLLEDPAWAATERRLTLDDLRAAEEVVVCNALRGVLPAMIDWVGATN